MHIIGMPISAPLTLQRERYRERERERERDALTASNFNYQHIRITKRDVHGQDCNRKAQFDWLPSTHRNKPEDAILPCDWLTPGVVTETRDR